MASTKEIEKKIKENKLNSSKMIEQSKDFDKFVEKLQERTIFKLASCCGGSWFKIEIVILADVNRYVTLYPDKKLYRKNLSLNKREYRKKFKLYAVEIFGSTKTNWKLNPNKLF